MKSLEDFKSNALNEAEEKDRRNFDMLVRAGLANKAQLQRIHKILDKMGEERPQFNNADKMILQNLFNKMVDLISNNKQISQKVRTAIREEEDLEEGILDTSDYKIGADGRKVKAHRLKVGSTEAELKLEDTIQAETEIDQLDEKFGAPVDPPAVLVLKRKAIRMFPNNTRIALYYNDKLKKVFSVPYATPNEFAQFQGMDATPVVTAEQVVQEAVMDQLHKIVKNKQAATVKFGNGQTRRVDGYTASAITQVHGALNDENKKKIADMVHKSPEHFHKVATFAFSKTK